MAEVQTAENSGEMTQLFINHLMMLGQQAAFFLGKIPHPETGAAEINLDAAKMFIDSIEMLREKTRGNLAQNEEQILTAILSDLQMGYVQAKNPAAAAPAAPETPQS